MSITNTYLIQLCGSLTQSVLHLNLSQANHPMGGVRANPFSRACTPPLHTKATVNARSLAAVMMDRQPLTCVKRLPRLVYFESNLKIFSSGTRNKSKCVALPNSIFIFPNLPF